MYFVHAISCYRSGHMHGGPDNGRHESTPIKLNAIYTPWVYEIIPYYVLFIIFDLHCGHCRDVKRGIFTSIVLVHNSYCPGMGRGWSD